MTMVRRAFLLSALALTALPLTASGCKSVQGNGTIATEERALEGFTMVEVRGAIKADVAIGSGFKVTVTGEDNLLPLVSTMVETHHGEEGHEHTILVVKLLKNVEWAEPIHVQIAAPEVSLVRGRGAVRLNVTGAKGDVLDVHLNGDARATLAGSVKKIVVDATGSAELDARKLSTPDAEVHLSGAGKIILGKIAKLDAIVSGAGLVSYEGNAEVTSKMNNASRLLQR